MLAFFAVALLLNVSTVSAATTSQSTTLSQSSQASQGSNQSMAPPVSPKVTFTTTQINSASSKVKTFVETNNRLPNYVTISNTQVSMAQFLQLQVDDVAAVNSGSTTPIVLKKVNNATNPTDSLKVGTLTKSEYLNVAQQISASINSTGAAPGSVNTSLGKMRFESMIYTYSKVLDYYSINKRLPNTVSVKPWSTSTTSTTTPLGEGSQTVDQILKTAAKFGYSSAAHDAAGLIKYGSGDCWAMSDYLFKQFSASGIKSRIVQYGTAYSSNHRSVQLYQNGAWVDVPYRTYGFNSMFNNTDASKYGSVIAST